MAFTADKQGDRVVLYSGLCKKKGYRRHSYSYVGSTAVKPTFPNRNSVGMEQSSLHRAVTMSCPPINESHDGLPHAHN
jgi:hypothetical protein